jgi:hypothetical protein
MPDIYTPPKMDKQFEDAAMKGGELSTATTSAAAW